MRTKIALAGLMMQKKKIHNFDPMDIIPLFLQQKKKVLKMKFGRMSPSGKAISIIK